MRLVALLIAVAACAPAPRPPHYPLHPRVRSAAGGPITLLGAVEHPGVIPYSPGITLTTALRLAGGPTGMFGGALLQRGDASYTLPVPAILDHAAPDPELAPGDTVTLRSVGD